MDWKKGSFAHTIYNFSKNKTEKNQSCKRSKKVLFFATPKIVTDSEEING